MRGDDVAFLLLFILLDQFERISFDSPFLYNRSRPSTNYCWTLVFDYRAFQRETHIKFSTFHIFLALNQSGSHVLFMFL